MAASTLPKPGTKYGPCATACKHVDCAQTREMSASLCDDCAEPIGYGARFYRTSHGVAELVGAAERFGWAHARCVERRADSTVAGSR